MSGPEHCELTIETVAGERLLAVAGGSDREHARFERMAPGPRAGVAYGPLSARNAAAARIVRPNLAPRPIGLSTSAGTGDRLGLATPGQAAAFRDFAPSLRAIFAQQSIREMDRLGRSPQQVLDDATFGCIEAGWTAPVGADADHLKTTDDIDRCLAAGFSLFTIDVGDFVEVCDEVPSDAELARLPWAELEDDLASARRRYAALRLELDSGVQTVGETELAHAMGKYGRAVAMGARLARHLMDRASSPVEIEIAVDETDEPTTPEEHVYIATELARLGIRWVSFAPRHLGSFEKGVEFAGDRAALYDSISRHAAIARALGPYKIGMHSGSDKFSIYDGVMEHTRGLVHLKTSGTSYLVALGVLATQRPELFRRAYAASLAAYRAARASYQVSAEAGTVPAPEELADAELPRLLLAPATRQILHVGYGAVLRTADGDGASFLGTELVAALTDHRDDYRDDLRAHFGRHLAPFSAVKVRS
ncbi:tagaturonate epimerase family protein [Agromyces soli]|uniref:Tagaturonate epimerase family protein n=1 Tax=Agromyces soli TaxID=659012 RepID=A0ABY4ATL5_9MICO|nr:tagaturonate epimerase family protein [Agromyces soli]UOE25206.1 tagaturonate epimerase family protein [Agromyces soli]